MTRDRDADPGASRSGVRLGVRSAVRLRVRFGVPPWLILRPMSPVDPASAATKRRCPPQRAVTFLVTAVVRPPARFEAVTTHRDRLRLRLPAWGGAR
jgi:hypothetical protein